MTTKELRAEVESLETVLRRIEAIERTGHLSAEELDALREIVRQMDVADAARRKKRTTAREDRPC